MVTLHARGGRRHTEWWLLSAGVVVSAVMLIAPVAIPTGIGLIVWSGILLRRRRAGALIATIVILSVTILFVGAVGVATLSTVSTPDSGTMLIQG